MNNNRNLIIFILASMALLFGHSWFTKKNMSQSQVMPAIATPDALSKPDALPTETSQPTPQNSLAEILTPADAGVIAPPVPVDRRARFIAGNEYLELTWRQYDGALVQAVWKQDNTEFFPKEVRELGGRLSSAEFVGIGGTLDAIFADPPEVEENEIGASITFSNGAGERISYFLPKDGYILEVASFSPSKNGIYLIRALNEIPMATDSSTGRQYQVNSFQGLDNGRIFSIEDKKIFATKWDKILTDPWFKSLGRKRKELPPASQRLGMDAGVETNRRQTTHYFAAIWDSNSVTVRDTARLPGYHATPDSEGSASARLYLGPKQAEYLATFHPAGEPGKGKPFLQVMDFGFFGLIAKFLFVVLRYIQSHINNWGWSLVTLSLLVRLSLWTLNTKTTKGMLRQKELEPYQKQIQAKYAKYGNDMVKKQEMQRELMAFYKKNGHNPLGSCLPALAQMPVFMALWSMLQAVFELRQAQWIFWIKDLSRSDPFFILPALMVGTMIAQQAMTPPMGDPQQRKMMMVIMPLMMGFFFAYTPAGLTLYYLFFNLVGMGQTWLLMRRHQPRPVIV